MRENPPDDTFFIGLGVAFNMAASVLVDAEKVISEGGRGMTVDEQKALELSKKLFKSACKLLALFRMADEQKEEWKSSLYHGMGYTIKEHSSDTPGGPEGI